MRSFIRNLTAALLVASLTVPAAAQREPESPRLVENIDVRIINVDVVVTDRKGNPVPNLKASDFEIYENGVLKPISNFYEIQGTEARSVVEVPEQGVTATAKADVPPEISEKLKRRIIFYIDNLSLAPFNRNRVFTQMKDFVKNVMRPGDEAMIATYNRSMKIRVPFTRDPLAINTMLDQLATESGLGIAARSERKSTEDRIREARSYDEAMATARSYASSVEHDLRQSVSSLTGLMTTLAGVEGKKILVLTSEGFPMQPGREAFYFIEEVGREKGWSNVGATLLEPMSFDGTRFVQQVAKTANANGITMYTVHAAGLTGGMEMSAEHSQTVSSMVSQAAISNTTESMQLMAEMTGGLASVQNNNFAEAFRRINRDLDSYYSLGYRAGTERVDRQRYLQVKVKQKGLIVRNRQTFVEKSLYAEMGDRVIANLLYKGKDNDMKILARVGSPRAVEDGLFQVPMDIQIPMESLTLLPQGEEYVGGFDIYVAVADKDGDMSDVSRKSHQLRISASDYKNLKGKYYTYTLDMLMARGLNKISVGVADQISSETGFAREQIIAQDLR
ncbi:MAG TPA: VWA domain-containing protein [Thermoanaerobaculia bacterium]